MKTLLKQLFIFFKKETVLCIAALLAMLSAFIIPPQMSYLSYIDWRVLALLFCLMLVVAGLRSIGVFEFLGNRLLKGAGSSRKLCFLLVFLCFFSSMLITNDVALITFVPFAVMILSMAGEDKLLIPVVVLQTIAANLGSMLTPVGNPQNLYLYSAFDLSMGSFLLYMLPLTVASAVLLAVSILLLPNHKLTTKKNSADSMAASPSTTAPTPSVGKVLAYAALFLVCLLCVLRILSWPVMLAISAVAILFLDRRLFLSVDYFLLLTFVCFFLFIGNAEQIPAVSELLRAFLRDRELLLGTLFSQIISNVPAAILLSGFTDKVRELLYGVNVGGLGTLIASLASVISYRLYGNSKGASKGAYLKTFTVYNIVFLVVLYALAWVLC